jgi:hypothetical protein
MHSTPIGITKFYLTRKSNPKILPLSKDYLNDNDNVGKFVNEHLERDKDSFVTLKDLKMLYKTSDCFDGQMTTLKVRLERVLGTPCLEQKRVDGVKYRGVFEGFKIQPVYESF